jgi:hypothetical protein
LKEELVFSAVTASVHPVTLLGAVLLFWAMLHISRFPAVVAGDHDGDDVLPEVPEVATDLVWF